MAEWELIIKSSAALCWCPNELFSSSHLLVSIRPRDAIVTPAILAKRQLPRLHRTAPEERESAQTQEVFTCQVTFCSFCLQLLHRL